MNSRLRKRYDDLKEVYQEECSRSDDRSGHDWKQTQDQYLGYENTINNSIHLQLCGSPGDALGKRKGMNGLNCRIGKKRLLVQGFVKEEPCNGNCDMNPVLGHPSEVCGTCNKTV